MEPGVAIFFQQGDLVTLLTQQDRRSRPSGATTNNQNAGVSQGLGRGGSGRQRIFIWAGHGSVVSRYLPRWCEASCSIAVQIAAVAAVLPYMGREASGAAQIIQYAAARLRTNAAVGSGSGAGGPRYAPKGVPSTNQGISPQRPPDHVSSAAAGAAVNLPIPQGRGRTVLRGCKQQYVGERLRSCHRNLANCKARTRQQFDPSAQSTKLERCAASSP